VAELVREGAHFADIGTDHAYLIAFLLEEGRIASAYASDIAEGPLQAARAHLAESGLLSRVLLAKRDGLSGLFSAFPQVSDIAICGMGGELIAKILSAEPRVKDSRIRLILQPMTRVPYLRKYLAREGFTVEREILVTDRGRLYSAIVAVYSGDVRELSPLEGEVGEYHLRAAERSPFFSRYIAEKLWAVQKKIEGLSRGGEDPSNEKKMEAALLSLLEGGNGCDGE
jgi:tRNA (adenine22-N1)-methyltransferase